MINPSIANPLLTPEMMIQNVRGAQIPRGWGNNAAKYLYDSWRKSPPGVLLRGIALANASHGLRRHCSARVNRMPSTLTNTTPAPFIHGNKETWDPSSSGWPEERSLWRSGEQVVGEARACLRLHSIPKRVWDDVGIRGCVWRGGCDGDDRGTTCWAYWRG